MTTPEGRLVAARTELTVARFVAQIELAELNAELMKEPCVSQVNDADQRIRATYAIDQLDAAVDGLSHWLATGERVQCPRCTQTVPATSSGAPVRHQLRGQWCDVDTTRMRAELTGMMQLDADLDDWAIPNTAPEETR